MCKPFRNVRCLVVGVVCAALSVAVCRAGDTDAPVPDCDTILAAVVANLPREPLRISGDLLVRRPKGTILRELTFLADVNWAAEPVRATYEIGDAFGDPLERLTVLRPDTGDVQFEYERGPSLQSAPLPNLALPVAGTDVSWTDLSFSFLWWRGGLVTGSDSVRGRNCYVLDVPAPTGQDTLYSRMRLWVDKKLCMLLQAEGYDESGTLVRRLWVKSFKKIDERWMVKDIEVQSYPSPHRTKLTVREVHVTSQL